VIIKAKQDIGGNGNMAMANSNQPENKVRIEYFGPRTGAVTYFGKRRKYRFGNNPTDRFQDVEPEDAEVFTRLAGFRIVRGPDPNYFAKETDFVPAPDGSVEQDPEPLDEPMEAPEAEPEAQYVETSPDLPGTVREIQAAVKDSDVDTLLAWLREEQAGNARVTAIKAIEGELENKLR
jgi:hypothetical protein